MTDQPIAANPLQVSALKTLWGMTVAEFNGLPRQTQRILRAQADVAIDALVGCMSELEDNWAQRIIYPDTDDRAARRWGMQGLIGCLGINTGIPAPTDPGDGPDDERPYTVVEAAGEPSEPLRIDVRRRYRPGERRAAIAAGKRMVRRERLQTNGHLYRFEGVSTPQAEPQKQYKLVWHRRRKRITVADGKPSGYTTYRLPRSRGYVATLGEVEA